MDWNFYAITACRLATFDNGHSGKPNVTNHRDTGSRHLQSGRVFPCNPPFFCPKHFAVNSRPQNYISMWRLAELLSAVLSSSTPAVKRGANLCEFGPHFWRPFADHPPNRCSLD
jgi:hypothetical protein